MAKESSPSKSQPRERGEERRHGSPAGMVWQGSLTGSQSPNRLTESRSDTAENKHWLGSIAATWRSDKVMTA